MITGQATQMESGARPCVECSGRGDVVMGPACSGCGCGGKIHGLELARCPRCEGAGVELCSGCEAPSVGVAPDGENYCAACLAEEEAA